MKKMVDNIPQYVLILGNLLSIIGVYLINKKNDETIATIQSLTESIQQLTKENKEITEKNLEISDTNKFISVQSKELIEKNIELTQLQKELIEQTNLLTGKVDSNTNKINNYITGGENFCFVKIVNIKNGKQGNSGRLLVLNEGENLLQNVGLRIIDQNTDDQYSITTMIDIELIKVGNISPNQFVEISDIINIDLYKGVNLLILISANNGMSQQYLKMRFVNGKWYSATRVLDTHMDKLIYEKIDENYPIQDKDEIFKFKNPNTKK